MFFFFQKTLYMRATVFFSDFIYVEQRLVISFYFLILIDFLALRNGFLYVNPNISEIQITEICFRKDLKPKFRSSNRVSRGVLTVEMTLWSERL